MFFTRLFSALKVEAGPHVCHLCTVLTMVPKITNSHFYLLDTLYVNLGPFFLHEKNFLDDEYLGVSIDQVVA